MTLHPRSMYIALLFICQLMTGQRVELVGLQIKKQLTQNDASAFVLGFMIKADEPIKTISKASKVLSFSDDTGLDILEAHRKWLGEMEAKSGKKSTSEMISLIDFETSRPLPDTLGFLVTMESRVLPNSNAKEIRIIADIVYKVLANQKQDSILIGDINLGELETIPWKGSEISFTKYPYNDSRKGKLYRISVQNDDLDAVVQRIELVDEKGIVIQDVKADVYPTRVEFSLPEIDAPINLKIKFKKLKRKTLLLDQKFGIGL